VTEILSVPAFAPASDLIDRATDLIDPSCVPVIVQQTAPIGPQCGPAIGPNDPIGQQIVPTDRLCVPASGLETGPIGQLTVRNGRSCDPVIVRNDLSSARVNGRA
jgi:hypothetical protein